MNEGKVWIVERGQYSDRHLVGVFTDEALAKTCALGCDGDAEEWPLNPHAEQYRQGLSAWHVQMTDNGTMLYVDRTNPPPAGQEMCRDHFSERMYVVRNGVVSLEKIPGDNWTNVSVVLYASVWAKDKEHAIKIVNERRAMHIVNGTWGEWDVLGRSLDKRRKMS
jgi:hypothetical protein